MQLTRLRPARPALPDRDISALGKTFGFVADELRRQYSLGYYPKKRPGAKQTRTIKTGFEIKLIWPWRRARVISRGLQRNMINRSRRRILPPT
jgi:hypothetical protein